MYNLVNSLKRFFFKKTMFCDATLIASLVTYIYKLEQLTKMKCFHFYHHEHVIDLFLKSEINFMIFIIEVGLIKNVLIVLSFSKLLEQFIILEFFTPLHFIGLCCTCGVLIFMFSIPLILNLILKYNDDSV